MAMPLALTNKPATLYCAGIALYWQSNAQFMQHSLDKLLLGEETLTPISCQSPYIAQQAHRRFAQAAVRFEGQRDKQVSCGPLASVLAALLFIAVGRCGACYECRSTAESASAWVNNGNVSNLQRSVELEENVSPSFGTICRLRGRFLRWWLLC
jgi:hypothetical protein